MSKTAFLFPGQGAQTVGMGLQLARSFAAAQALYDRAAEILGYDLARLCFQGPAETLNSTRFSQPALFVTSLAALESLRVEAPDAIAACAAVAGLSLGEYTALVMAGALDFETGLRLVQVRGEAMQEAADAVPSGMVSILGLDEAQVADLCDRARAADTLEIANRLCPGNIAVSGTQAACARITELARRAGAMRVVPLTVGGAFHTPLMEGAVARLSAVLDEVVLKRPTVPVVSNVDARPHVDPNEIRRLLTRQVVCPVLWEGSMRWLIDLGFTRFFEIGPGRVLRSLLKRIHRRIPCHSIAA
ncbi:MAG: [acyl-carrier-protein] S-malonyltransferase [Planctomycetes bacterium RBG_16_64_10]|nr:MAG: [acyl-carrier-protein] S-malonyltransferase [Planctomycetes bacterium RBG_16_64_10]